MALLEEEAHDPLLARHSPTSSPTPDSRPSTHWLDGVQRDVLVHEDTRSFVPELRDLNSNTLLLAQGHKAAMRRSFSPLAALGLGFRHVHSTHLQGNER